MIHCQSVVKDGLFAVGGHGPIAFGAGGGVGDGVAAHAAVAGVERVHELFAPGTVAGVEQVALVLVFGGQVGEHDAAFAVTDTGAGKPG
jgi:hypothetical protein